MVEIGPGRGILTRELAGRCRRLIAVEIDERLVAGLRAEFAGAARVVVLHDDFFEFELPRAPYKAFGNIPYGRTAESVRRLVNAPVPPEDAYLVAQIEAAERFAGGPHARETLTSLLLKPWWRVEIARRLRRTDFDPPPSVDSALLWLAKRPRPLVIEPQRSLYEGFIDGAFGRRGETVRRCLRPIFTGRQLSRLVRDLRFDLSSPPSGLSFDQWLGLFRYFALVEGERRRV